MTIFLRVGLATFVLVVSVQSGIAGALYHVTDLGTLPGDTISGATGINSGGEIVGAGASRAFLWTSADGMQDLGVLPGDNRSGAAGVNNAGQVVGVSLGPDSSGNDFSHAFLWTSAEGMHALQAVDGDIASTASAINASGQISGSSLASQLSADEHSVLWNSSSAAPQLLGSSGGSIAYGINDHGEIVGYAGGAFIWTAATGIQNLGSFSAENEYGVALDINSSTHVVGFAANDDGVDHAFLWTSAEGMLDLGDLSDGLLDSTAFGINSAGQIVGESRVPDDPANGVHAFLWTATDGMLDLNDLVDSSGVGWTFTFATDINDSGWIVGDGINPDGFNHAFLLTPIPEPSTAALAVCGAMAIGCLILRRARAVSTG